MGQIGFDEFVILWLKLNPTHYKKLKLKLKKIK